jgi:hypothetical protein
VVSPEHKNSGNALNVDVGIGLTITVAVVTGEVQPFWETDSDKFSVPAILHLHKMVSLPGVVVICPPAKFHV